MPALKLTYVAPCLYRATSGTFYSLLKRDGRQFRRSLGTSDRRVADAELERRRTGQPPTGSPTFSQLAGDWLKSRETQIKASSYRRFQQTVKALGKLLGNIPVHTLTQAHVEDYLAKRGERLSPVSYRKDCYVWKVVLKLAQRRGIPVFTPDFPRRKMRSKRPEVPTNEQFQLMLATMRKRKDRRAHEAAFFAELMAYSGMRLAEARWLRWADIDFERGEFRVTGGSNGTKNGHARVVPLFPAMRELLERMRAFRLDQLPERVVLMASPRKPMWTACKRAGLPLFNRHALRHYFLTGALEKGVPVHIAASWAGHADAGALLLRTYTHLRKPESYQWAQKM